jgi:hypothetical protein
MRERFPGQSVRFGAWVFIFLTLLMSFASIWVFLRITPATAKILEQNDRSIAACETMLAAMITGDKDEFNAALTTAEANITEPGEPAAVASIKLSREVNSQAGRQATVRGIQQLAAINRQAMEHTDRQVQQFGTAGAWGVVFMATTIFLIGMIFLRGMRRNLIIPLLEIDAVTRAQESGNTMRRCYIKNPSREVQQIFKRINTVLDRLEEK